MGIGPWLDTTWCEHKALALAKEKAPFLYDEPGRVRTLATKVPSAYVGTVGEATHALQTGQLKWWIRRQLAIKGLTDDGGFDFPGVGIKTIAPGHQRVKVYERVDSAYPDVYFVYEWDEALHKIRLIGRFGQRDVGVIAWPDGSTCKGVYVSQLV